MLSTAHRAAHCNVSIRPTERPTALPLAEWGVYQMSTSNKDYYRVRALEEGERAAAANEPNIAAIHRDLAEKYEALATEDEVQPILSPEWDGMSGAQLA